MRNNHFFLICWLLTTSIFSYGQENSLLLEQGQEEYQDYGQISSMEHKTDITLYNLNTISEQELLSLHLLSPIQIENILLFRRSYGYFISEAELYNINGFEAALIEELLQYSFIGPVPKKEKLISSYVHTKCLIGATNLLEKEAFKIKLHTQIGQTLSTSFSQTTSYGNTALNGYLSIKKHRAIPLFLVGNYRITFGQGLSLWNGFAFSSPFSSQKTGKGIQGTTSTGDTTCFRGMAATFRKKRNELSIFYSHKTTENTMGGFYEYTLQKIKIGAVFYSSYFTPAIQTPTLLYKKQLFSGQINNVGGIHYQSKLSPFQLFGEISTSSGSTYHFLQGIEGKPHRDIRISILYRHYQPNLSTNYTHPFSVGTSAGEEGFLLAIQWAIHPIWQINVSSNYGLWESITYRKDFPSYSHKQLCAIQYQPSLEVKSVFTYTRHTTSYNQIDKEFYLANPIQHTKQQYRWELIYHPLSWLKLNSRIEVATYDIAHMPTEIGVLFFQDAHLTFKQTTLHLRYALFDIPSYNTRLYAYENELAYEMSIPAYYKNGARYVATFSYRITHEIAIGIRMAYTLYTPSLEDVPSLEGNTPSLKAQLRYTFASKPQKSLL